MAGRRFVQPCPGQQGPANRAYGGKSTMGDQRKYNAVPEEAELNIDEGGKDDQNQGFGNMGGGPDRGGG